MFFSKIFIAAAALVLASALQVQAHTVIQPMLGLGRDAVRNDAFEPADNQLCGNVDIASTFDSSPTIAVKSDHTFQATIRNFNSGVDGSRQIVEAKFDPTGTGNSFQDMKILINGQRSPSDESGSEQVFFQLLGDCKGGANGKKCLVALKAAGGFGNCIVVEQRKGRSGRSVAAVRREPRAEASTHEHDARAIGATVHTTAKRADVGLPPQRRRAVPKFARDHSVDA
ncbi:uncharacterized protein BXZ73DRAFT_75004 [Epithele typhae]|uniref:uncharacterized protein n=1 Tax=Epithele typhae TaxID=378194 RepID=UPI0020083BB1|nr:uncharacterized protein BXZ73DRAFT_75004 [Epithele typhae]KAH9941824.1 hypothetical protein BXZ73DRAFT_75004 [Epithele typhae]